MCVCHFHSYNKLIFSHIESSVTILPIIYDISFFKANVDVIYKTKQDNKLILVIPGLSFNIHGLDQNQKLLLLTSCSYKSQS